MNNGGIVEHNLPNGLRVLLEENHSAPVISLNVCYRAGSKYERPGITGISHFLEHLMFKSTPKHPNGEFDRLLTYAGADNNAYTWLDRTVYYELIAADKIELALELEADRMRNLLILPDELADEREVVQNELEQRDDSPFSLLLDTLQSAAFTAHPYGIPTIGWLEDVKNLALEDVRNYYDAYYRPDNVVLVAVGDFKPEEMLAKIERYFGGIEPGNHVAPKLATEPPQRAQRRIVISRAGSSDYVLIGWKAPASTSRDSYALEVLANVLGSGRTSRLSLRLVETGKASNAGALSGCFDYVDPHLFAAQAVLNEGTSPEEAEASIIEEASRIATEGITERELARAKKQARVSFVYRKDSVEAEADLLVNFEIASSYKNIADYLPGIEAVTASDVQEAAGKYLTTNTSTVGWHIGIRAEGMGRAEGAMPLPTPRELAPRRSAMERSPQEPAGIKAAAPDVITLANGMRLIVIESHYNPTVALAGRVELGSVNDPPGKEGLAGMTMQLLSEGTELHDKLEIAGMMEDEGMGLGYFAGRELSGIMGRSLAEDLPKLLGMLAEEMLRPAFPDEQVEFVRVQVLNNIQRAQDDTFDRAYDYARKQLFGEGNPYAGNPNGTKESVKAITRDDILGFYRQHVSPQRIILSIAGDVDTGSANNLLEELFGGWNAGEAQDEGLFARSLQTLPLNGREEIIEMADRSNATVLFLRTGISRTSEDYYAAMVANHIFGGDFIARLNEKLRVQEGLTYGSFSFLSPGFGVGPWAVCVQANPANAARAKDIALAEWKDMFENGARQEELERSKSYLTGNFAVKLNTVSAVANLYADIAHFRLGMDYMQIHDDILNSLTLAQVNAAFRKYLSPDGFISVIAGSLSQSQP
jgi:zinc protease